MEQPASVQSYSYTTHEVIRQVRVELDRGLISAEVQRRLAADGFNELPSGDSVPWWRLFLLQFKDFVVLLLIAASAISILLGDIAEGLAIIAIVILNAAIGLIQERRADAALAALKKMAAPDAQVLRDGMRSRVPARELVGGDIVFLEAGNYVPADIRLIEAFNLKINESALTGESNAVSKRAEAVIEAGAAIGDRLNMAYSSTLVTYGRAKGVVVGTGLRTEIGVIARMLGEIEEESTPLQKRLNQLGKTLSLVALLLCGLVFVVEVLRNTDLSVLTGQGIVAYITTYSKNITEFFILAVSLAVAAVPEGLAAVVTINLALGMREMVKRNALIRRLSAVETLGSASAICTDKTGTLTQNAMNVVHLYTAGRAYRVTGEGYQPTGEFEEIRDLGLEIENRPVSNLQSPISNLLLGGLLASDALLEESGTEGDKKTYRIVGDPTEAALVVAAAKAGLWRDEVERAYPRVAEAPFDATRKMMSTVHLVSAEDSSLPGAQRVYTKGAPGIVASRCTHTIAEDGAVKPLTDDDRNRIVAVNTAMGSDALRVLAVAMRDLPTVGAPLAGASTTPDELEHDLTLLGLVGMMDPPRAEVITAIQTARRAGIRTIMVTGDHAVTARAIARQIGLVGDGHGGSVQEPKVISGNEIEAMSDEQLAASVKDVSVFARVSPEHKVRIVTAVKSNGNIVAMTGDGVNDAPALKRADIGVAMGISGTDVSKETADMVLTDDNYASIVSAVEQGRVIYSNIRKFVFYLLGSNVAEILIIFLATVFGLKSPLAAIQLLWLNLATDGAPSLALGLEKGDPDIMSIPPRPAHEPIINRRMILGMLTQTTALTLVVLLVYVFALGVYPEQAQTMGFLTLSLAELPLAYTARSERYPLLKIGLFSNRVMQWAVLSSIVGLLAVTYIPFLNGVFYTTPLGLQHWVIVLPAIIVPALVAELTKLVARRLRLS
jgi:Ca2+-transporting ATPase